MTTNGRMGNIAMEYSYNEILYISVNEWTTTMCVDMDEPHYWNIEWKKPGAKNYMLYDSIYVSFQSRWKNVCY